MSIAAQIAICIAAGLGTLFVVIAGIGVVRLPSPLDRAHALTLGMTLGLALLLLALWLDLGTEVTWLKLSLAVAFQFITIPVAAHLLSRVALSRLEQRQAEEKAKAQAD